MAIAPVLKTGAAKAAYRFESCALSGMPTMSAKHLPPQRTTVLRRCTGEPTRCGVDVHGATLTVRPFDDTPPASA